MNRTVQRRIVLGTIALLLLQSPVSAMAKAKAKSTDKATYTIIHAIPSGNGADKVDVYANNTLIIDNATPGAMKSFTVDRGNVQIKIFADGVSPSSDTAAVLTSNKTYLTNGENVSFVAFLGADGKPRISMFKNMITEAGKKRGWLTVRHVAAAPEVNIRAGGATVIKNLANGMERKSTFNTKTYSVDVVLSDSPSVVAIPAANVSVQNETNTVVYAWGSAAQRNLGYLIQQVPIRK